MDERGERPVFGGDWEVVRALWAAFAVDCVGHKSPKKKTFYFNKQRLSNRERAFNRFIFQPRWFLFGLHCVLYCYYNKAFDGIVLVQ
jgi:hypothetical protein